MVTGLLALPPRLTAEVMAAELVTGVVVAELLCTLLASVKKQTRVNLGLENLVEMYCLSKTGKANSPLCSLAV